MNALEHRIKAYADARWPDRDIKDKIKKLGEEFFELIEAAAEGDDAALMLEAADMAILLADLVALKGGSLERCVAVKVDILEERLALVRSAKAEAINEDF